MISSTVLVQLIEGLCLKRIAYRSCSKEWAFLGFHRISDIQFFWRWNISPSSLLVDRKMSTKSKIVRQVFPKEADMLIFHVTWWKSVCCYMTHDVFPFTVTFWLQRCENCIQIFLSFLSLFTLRLQCPSLLIASDS